MTAHLANWLPTYRHQVIAKLMTTSITQISREGGVVSLTQESPLGIQIDVS